MNSAIKYSGSLVEYLDRGGLHLGFVTREQGDKLVIRDRAGHERSITRELVIMRHGAPHGESDVEPAARMEALETEKAELRNELDLTLLWEVVQEQGRAFSAEDLAELFFGRRSSAGAAVMLEALIADRIYFVRRNREFMVRSPEQVERLRVQESRVRMRSEEGRRTRELLSAIIASDARINGVPASPEETAPLAAELRRYLKNPSTRSQELTVMLAQAAPDVDPVEVAFEVLERLGRGARGPKVRRHRRARDRVQRGCARSRRQRSHRWNAMPTDGPVTFSIDDEETLEVDDALSCEVTAEGHLRVGIHIALVADFVARGGAMDREAAARATTVYLPETTVRMLPEEICCRRASLIAGERRPVLSTSVLLSPNGELLDSVISPRNLKIGHRLSYAQADRILDGTEEADSEVAAALRRLYEAALELRERRKRAGAMLITRREPKVRVHGDEIEIEVIDNNSPSRLLVAEFMVLNNFVAASYAAERRIPIIYRVQPAAGDAGAVRAHLSVYPEYHAGAGLKYYAQLSSPIRRYADLVLQRQLVSSLADAAAPPYDADGILAVLANTENAEAEAKELERRARRYWILRYLQRQVLGHELSAVVTRDGVSAELDDYAVRGALRGAPNVSTQTRIRVRIARVDPLHGWLSFDYLGTVSQPRPGTSEQPPQVLVV